MTEIRGATVVIGLGNPLMADDGVGLAALEELRALWRFDPPVELVDGGTWGMNLLHILEDASRVLILDAIDAGEAPGTLITLERDELPRLFALKISPHQIDFRDVLALADLRGTMPSEIVAVGLQPDLIEMATALSTAVSDGLPQLIDRAVTLLDRWGHEATRGGALIDA